MPAVIPSLVFPLFFAALNTAAMSRSISLPGFPRVDSFLDFIVAATIVQGVTFGSTVGGADLARDVEDGFFERLLASPVARTSILVGRLAGSTLLGAVQAVFFTVVLVAFGASVKGGPVAVVALAVSGAVIGLAFGGFMAAMALKTGSSEAVQGAFPLLFIALFLSSAFFPRETMNGWYRTVADWNPVSHMVEGMRALVIDDLTAGALARAVGIPAVIAAVSISLALVALRGRVAQR
jgi:ABC-2 type transport system permease protein